MPNYFQEYRNGQAIAYINKYTFKIMNANSKVESKLEQNTLYVWAGENSILYQTSDMAEPAELTKEELGCDNVSTIKALQPYKYRILEIATKKGHALPAPVTPSTTHSKDVGWLYAKNHDHTDDMIVDTTDAGKWMLFYDKDTIDDAWSKILTAVESGDFWSVKASTDNPDYEHHALLTYVWNKDDILEVIAAYDRLEKLGLFKTRHQFESHNEIKFKTDAQTINNEYGEDAYVYKSTDLPVMRAYANQKLYLNLGPQYDVRLAGKAVINNTVFADTKAIFNGERKLFANTRAWLAGNGTLFADTKATLTGRRPIFASTRTFFGGIKPEQLKQIEINANKNIALNLKR